MYFSIAPQVVGLPDGTRIEFRVNTADTSLVEMVAAGHVVTFKRNGALLGSSPIPDPTPLPEPPLPPIPMGEQAPLVDYASVNDEPVRGILRDRGIGQGKVNTSQSVQPDRGYTTPVDPKPAA